MNVEQMEELVRISGDMKVTMHGPLMYVKIHMKRVGTMCSALGSIRSDQRTEKILHGMEEKMLKELKERAKGRIEILAGAGNQSGADQR